MAKRRRTAKCGRKKNGQFKSCGGKKRRRHRR